MPSALAGPGRLSPMRLLTLGVLAASLATASCGPRNQDKLEDGDLAGAARGKSDVADTRCGSRLASDEIKRQLFARAAEVRGSNADNYAKIAGFALIDVADAEPASAVSSGELVDCRARVTLRLPAGLRVAGGRTTLGGDIGYNIAPGANGMVTLGQSDAITIPLATLTQMRSAQTRVEPQSEAAAPASQDEAVPPAAAPVSPRPEPVAGVDVANPSFDCRRAQSPSERAVCDSPSLAALDRDMAARYRSGTINGGPDERRLLAQTRDRFLAYRDRCQSDSCIASVYRGRMREIDDILAGRWRAPR